METETAPTVAKGTKQVKMAHVVIASLCTVIAGMAFFGWNYLTRTNPVEVIRSAVMPVNPTEPTWVATIYGEQDALLRNPRKVLVQDREIFVSDTMNNRILVFDHTGRYLRKIGTEGEDGAEGRLVFPYGMAIVANELYVADAGLNKVLVFDSEGRFQRYFGEDLFAKPVDIAYANGMLYFTDVAHHQVIVANLDGTEALRFGGPGRTGTDGVFWFPNGIEVLPDGRILVADTNNSRIQVFSATGEFLTEWQGDIERRQGIFASPSGIAVDREGNIYVADPLTRRVTVLDSSGQPIGAINLVGNPGDGDSLNIPYGVAVDQNQRLYVTDYGASRLVIYDLN